MPDPAYQTTAVTIRGVDGNDISVSGTHDRKELVVAINEHGEQQFATVKLSREQFESLCQTRFSLEVKGENAETKEGE